MPAPPFARSTTPGKPIQRVSIGATQTSPWRANRPTRYLRAVSVTDGKGIRNLSIASGFRYSTAIRPQ